MCFRNKSFETCTQCQRELTSGTFWLKRYYNGRLYSTCTYGTVMRDRTLVQAHWDLVRQVWLWERDKRWFRLLNESGRSGRCLGQWEAGKALGLKAWGQPIILVTRMIILFFIYQSAMVGLGKCPGTLWKVSWHAPGTLWESSRGRSAWSQSQD